MATTASKTKSRRKPAAKSRKRATPGKTPPRRIDPKVWVGILLHPLSRRIYGAVMITIVFAGLYHASLISLSGMPRFQLRTQDLIILDQPPWIPPGGLAQLTLPADVIEPLSIFNPRLVEILSAAYARMPWVERVIRVEKVYPNDLRVELRLRKPVAAVYYQNEYIMIDRKGVRLPGNYAERPEVGFRMPFVRGVRSAPPEPGIVWDTPAVLDAARLAERWHRAEMQKLINVTCIDVTNVDVTSAASEVVLLLESLGTRVLWGRVSRPGLDGVLADDQKKIDILRNALVRDGILARDPQLKLVQDFDMRTGRLVIKYRTGGTRR